MRNATWAVEIFLSMGIAAGLTIMVPDLNAFQAGHFLASAHAQSATGHRDVSDIAEVAVESVVNISSTKRVARGDMPQNDPFFRYFFGPNRRPPLERGNSLGSGVVISDDGLILTNNHVVEGADEIAITLSNGRELNAEIVGTDPKSDVAVLRLQGDVKGIKAMAIGNSSALRLGETVLAIGNPFGLGHTVTMGIVSAKGRANMGITDYEDFIQTDAAINPGNSGGALVNLRGELVGINTAIASRTGGYQGIGFAIPADMAKAIMTSLVTDGRVARGWLGVGIQPLDKRLAERLGLSPEQRGVLITGVMPDTPAADAGIQAGDVVTHIDGVEMPSPAQLRNSIAMKGAGTSVDLKILRERAFQEKKVVLGELEDQRRTPVRRPKKKQSNSLGMTLEDLDARTRRSLGIEGRNGVVVRSVDPGSPAAKAGIRPRDVILQVDGKGVRSAKSARATLGRGTGDLLIRLSRGQGNLFAVIERKSDK